MSDVEAQNIAYKLMSNFFGELDPNYDPEKDPLPQVLFRHNEISIADYLMRHREALVNDFLTGFNGLEDAIYSVGRNVIQKKDDRSPYTLNTPDADGTRFHDAVEQIVRKNIDTVHSIKNPAGWKNVELKYHDPYNNIHWDIDPVYAKAKYPTAYKLIQEFGDDCPISSYSYLAPKTSIHRHTGPENRDGEYIRIHVPLIIPSGDLFFEVNGEEVKWDKVFAFDNQFAHSAHNLSDGHRLIFLIDIRRSRIGLPQGQKWNKNRQLYAMSKPFIRKGI